MQIKKQDVRIEQLDATVQCINEPIELVKPEGSKYTSIVHVHLEEMSPFIGATDTPVLDLW